MHPGLQFWESVWIVAKRFGDELFESLSTGEVCVANNLFVGSDMT